MKTVAYLQLNELATKIQYRMVSRAYIQVYSYIAARKASQTAPPYLISFIGATTPPYLYVCTTYADHLFQKHSYDVHPMFASSFACKKRWNYDSNYVDEQNYPEKLTQLLHTRRFKLHFDVGYSKVIVVPSNWEHNISSSLWLYNI